MTIIFGESSSGKSTLALEMIRKVPKAIYFALDNDKSLQEKLEDIKNDVEVKILEDPFMIDIEMELIQKGGIKNDVTHVIIDPINFIRHTRLGYSDKDKEDLLLNTISSLEYIESAYSVKVIAIFNTLRNVEKPFQSIMKYGKDHSLIATTKRKFKSKKNRKKNSVRG